MKIAYLLMILLIPCASAKIVINEIHYDPIGSENDFEAIEFLNTGNTTIDISGYNLTTSGSTDATIPEGTIITGGSYYLLADEGYNDTADHYENIQLSNTGGSAEFAGNFVSWGDHDENSAELCSEGESLTRINDTNNSKNDFTCMPPTLRSSSDKEINYIFTVIDKHPLVNITINEDDNTTPGLQIIPTPGEFKELEVIANIEDDKPENLSCLVIFDNQEYTMSKNETECKTSIPIEYFKEPGMYNLTTKVTNYYNLTTTKENSLHILETKAIQIDVTDIICDVIQGQTCTILGDEDLLTKDKPTVKNIGNTKFDLSLQSTPPTHENITLPSIEYSFLSEMENPVQNTTLQPSFSTPISIEFSAPVDADEAPYSGTIEVVSK